MTIDGKIPADVLRLAAEQTLELTPVDAAHVSSRAYGAASRGRLAPKLGRNGAIAYCVLQVVPRVEREGLLRDGCAGMLRLPIHHNASLQVQAVMRLAMDKLALVGSITVDPKLQAAELTQRVGEEITRMIQAQKDLEQRFEQLVAAQHTLRNLPNKSKLRENQVALQQVAEQLRSSTRALCRSLKDNPNVAENMAKVCGQTCDASCLTPWCNASSCWDTVLSARRQWTAFDSTADCA